MLAVFALARLTATSQSAVAAAQTPPVSSAVWAGLEDPGHLDPGPADLGRPAPSGCLSPERAS